MSTLGIYDGSWSDVDKILAKGLDHPNQNVVNQLKAYRDAIDVNIISSITDKTGTIIYANENFCRISQYTASELIGKNHRIICSGFHSKEFFSEMWKTITSGKTWHGEIKNRAKNGSFYWVDTVIIPVNNEKGEIENFLSLRQLITERKESERQKDRYVEMLEEIANMVAHEMRGPLCRIVGLVDILVEYDNSQETKEKAVEYLLQSTDELNALTRKLSDRIYAEEMQMKVEMFKTKMKTRFK
jgi:PAS domain S-box-containing protein